MICRLQSTSGFGVRPARYSERKSGEHLLAVLAREVDAMQRQAELEADAARILELACIVAVAVVLPIAHVQALHGMARVAQQQRDDGGIYATR